MRDYEIKWDSHWHGTWGNSSCLYPTCLLLHQNFNKSLHIQICLGSWISCKTKLANVIFDLELLLLLDLALFSLPCWTVKVRHESDTHNGLVAQWLELLVQFRVVQGSIPCEVILLFGYLGYVSWHTHLTVSMLSNAIWALTFACLSNRISCWLNIQHTHATSGCM